MKRLLWKPYWRSSVTPFCYQAQLTKLTHMNQVVTEIQKYLDTCGLPYQMLSDTTMLVQSPSGVAVVDCTKIGNAISSNSSTHSISDLVNAQIRIPEEVSESPVDNVDVARSAMICLSRPASKSRLASDREPSEVFVVPSFL